MHPALLAVVSHPDLPASAKAVWTHVYAYTNGRLDTDIPLSELCEGLRMCESTLRRNRKTLREAGFLDSWYIDGEAGEVVLHCELRAPSARDAHLVRVEDGVSRAPSAREDDEPRAPSARDAAADAHLVRAEPAPRAPSARALGARPMRNDAQKSPAPASIELVKQQQQQQDTCCCSESEGVQGETGPDPDVAGLLGAAGVAPHIVAKLAGMDFETAARHVAAWQIAREKDKRLTAGALVTRLRSWALPEDLTAEALQSGLLADRVTDEHLRAWGVQRKKSILDGYDYIPPGYEGIIHH